MYGGRFFPECTFSQHNLGGYRGETDTFYPVGCVAVYLNVLVWLPGGACPELDFYSRLHEISAAGEQWLVNNVYAVFINLELSRNTSLAQTIVNGLSRDFIYPAGQ